MKTSDNSVVISKIPEILEVKRVLFTKKHEELVGLELAKICKRNSQKIFVYRIVYRSQGHKVVGFIVEPRTGDHLPSVIYNRGGSGEFGALKSSMFFLRIPAQLALHGYVVIASQYSGNAGGEGKDEMGGSDIEDVLVLKKILTKYRRVNSEKIGMHGMSRGGMMTYLSLARVNWLKAVVTVGGVTNLIRQEKLRPEMKEHFKKMFGGSLSEKKKRSALFWADQFYKKTPLLIMHGSSDWRVSPLDSIELVQKLLALYIPHRLVLFEGADHSLSERANESLKLTLYWFDRFLKNNEPLPDMKLHGI